MTNKNTEEEKEEVEEKHTTKKVAEYPKIAEKCEVCDTTLLLKTGPGEHDFKNTKAGMTKASSVLCRKCYDLEISGKSL